MEHFVLVCYQLFDNYAFLMISAIGLAINYGMMGIINMAHGEFIMLGAYVTTLLVHSGVPFPLAVACSALSVGIFGGLLDMLFISRLYNRPLDSIVATWGLSLILSQGCLIVMGPTLPSFSVPFSSISAFGSTYPAYRLLLIGIAILLPILLYLMFAKTRFGLESRATMQRPQSAGLLGTNSRKMYSFTFMIGSAFAGLSGGLYAPTVTVAPTMGQFFQMQSFVTVVVGGLNPLLGTVSSAASLGVIQGVISVLRNAFFGRLALFIVAILILRVIPGGLSSFVEKCSAYFEKNRRSDRAS